MRVSSMCLLTVSLLCFLAHPLQSDPQGSSWSNYGTYNPADSRSYAMRPIQVNSEGYASQSIYKHAVKLPRYNGIPEDAVYLMNHSPLHSPPELSSIYGKRVQQTKHLNEMEHERYYNLPSITLKEKKNNNEEKRKEEEVLEKMKMLNEILSEDINNENEEMNGIVDKVIPEESKRIVRQVRKEKPGFFWTIARVTFETINDTRSAIKQIGDIINNSIAPETTTKGSTMSAALTAADSMNIERNSTAVNETETTTSSPMATTMAPFVLTRSSLQSLIRRNVLGLVRLFNIEWNEALNESESTVKEFQKDLGNQVGIYLRDNPNAY